jgi:hypothetical protein
MFAPPVAGFTEQPDSGTPNKPMRAMLVKMKDFIPFTV